MAAIELRGYSFLLAFAAAAALAGCNSTQASLSGKVTVDGSDTVFPLTKAMAAAFRQSNPGVEFAIEFSGTGGGFKKFCAGQLDIEDASRPITSAESEQCKAQHIEFIEVPVAFDSLSVVVNPQNSFVDCLTIHELKTTWEPGAEGRIRQWDQIRPSFPQQPLVLFGPGKASGTFDYFTFAVVGEQGSSRNDYTQSDDYVVVERGVAADPNALGYFGYAYYQANRERVRAVAIDSGHGCVLPSPQTVADGTYAPLSRPLFVYVRLSSASRPEVDAFTHFYLSPDSTGYVTKVGYVPLPVRALVTQTERFEKRATGSMLGAHGSVTGVALNTFDDEEKEKDRIRDALVQ